MSRPVLPLLALAALLLVPAVASAQSSSTTAPGTGPAVMVVKVDGSIDGTVDRYLRDALAQAERAGAAVVIQLDSAGTLDGDPVALAERVHSARVPVIVWTGPAPAKAQGAGLLLMYAASEAAVAPGVGIGPTLPLDLADGDARLIGKSVIPALAVGWANDFGREPPTLFP